MTLTYNVVTAAPVPEHATSYQVAMRDGVRLATDFYRARTDSDTAPTILIRLPYDKCGSYTFIPDVADYMVARGYHVVAQDVRGKFRSEGESLEFVNEVNDGYDSIDWIIHQPWSDGTVAMWGDSYYGYTQLAAASSRHPALRAIAPRVTGTRLGELPIAHSGQNCRDVEMAVILLYTLTHFHSRDTYEWTPDWTRRPYLADIERFQQLVGARSASFDLLYPNPIVLRRFPEGHLLDAPPVPMLHTIGWWDNCAPWSWRDQADINTHPAWAHNEYLLIESIDHDNNVFDADRTGQTRMLEMGAYLGPALDFFDVFVRGLASPDSIPKVRWHLAGSAGYQVDRSWPPAGLAERVLHLDVTGDLRDIPSEPTGAMQWLHDPDDLVPTSPVDPFAYLEALPDERALAGRDDVLVFAGSPTTEPTNLVGPVHFSATVTSTGPTMDVFVRLYDRAPDGHLTRIARGQTHLLDATAGHVVQIDMGQLGYRLSTGHRLQLHVCSSDFPEFVPQPGTGECPWRAIDVRPNTQSMLVGGPEGATVTVHTLGEVGPPRDQRGRVINSPQG